MMLFELNSSRVELFFTTEEKLRIMVIRLDNCIQRPDLLTSFQVIPLVSTNFGGPPLHTTRISLKFSLLCEKNGPKEKCRNPCAGHRTFVRLEKFVFVQYNFPSQDFYCHKNFPNGICFSATRWRVEQYKLLRLRSVLTGLVALNV